MLNTESVLRLSKISIKSRRKEWLNLINTTKSRKIRNTVIVRARLPATLPSAKWQLRLNGPLTLMVRKIKFMKDLIHSHSKRDQARLKQDPMV